jgi:tellurite resistance protein TerC
VLYVALGGQAALVACAYWWERREHAAEHLTGVRGAVVWSGLWLAFGLLPALWFGLVEGSGAANSYAAVYLIERALSLDNVFVFAVLIAAFEIPPDDREHLVSIGALAAFAMRVPAILGGVALVDASNLVAYALGGLLLILAWRTARSGKDPSHGRSRMVTILQRRLPVSDHVPRRWIVVRDGRRQITPLLLCLTAIAFADIAFAVDSIPAALAISHDSAILLTANLLALLGLRALYELVTVARERLVSMDQTIAVLLLLVGLKLLTGEIVDVGPLVSLLAVLTVLAAGTVVSLRAGERGTTEDGEGGIRTRDGV